MKEFFSRDGYLAQHITGFEYRKEQEEMAAFVLERLVEEEVGIVEAGTGTGKTLAYLIPSLVYALESEKTVAVTTETKALQKQLLDKDLPLVQEIFSRHLDRDISYSLCLGSANYPCRRRYETILKRGTLEKEDIARLSLLGALFEEDRPFSRFDVRLPNRIWSQVCREPDGCNSFRCMYASGCAYQRARKEWQDADLLVMNHYLFFTNIASGKVYLPETEVVIFDEAHSMEDIAAAQLGFSLSIEMLAEILDRLYRKTRRSSLLMNIRRDEEKRRALELFDKIVKEGGRYFEKMRSLFPRETMQLRLREPAKYGESLVALCKNFLQLLNDVEDDFDEEYLKLEYDIARGRLFAFTENLTHFVFQNLENQVYWIERNSSDLLGSVVARSQPVGISDIMRREVVEHFDAAVFVSATLAVKGDFSYIAGRLGLSSSVSLSLASPFDYASQLVLFLGRHMTQPGEGSYIAQAAESAAEVIRTTGGNCLVLFTSYRMLEDVRKKLADLVENRLYSQGDLTSSEAMEYYLDDDGAVLLGTHSFWQGIDLPGDLLRAVIMMRLPFSVPDSPPVQARVEALKERGLNPFMAYQVPEAVIKFKQGFGRLIRSSRDVGIVAVLDPRIVSKSYGRYFLQSLPPTGMAQGFDQLREMYLNLRG